MFRDNDFYFTCTSFLKALLPDKEFTHPLASDIKFTKSKVVQLFNAIVPSLYLLKQNAWRYQETDPSYFKITENNVYLDDEVDQYMVKTRGDYNGEFFVVDFEAAHVWSM